MNNIDTIGTFTEYMDSIVVEIRHLLSSQNYLVNVENRFWGTATEKEGGTPVKVIFISEDNDGPNVSFSIARLEFMTLRQYAPKALVDLATTRFSDAIDSLKELHNEFGSMIEKLTVGVK